MKKTISIITCILYTIIYLTIFKGTAFIIKNFINISGTIAYLVHYTLTLALLLLFIFMSKKQDIIKFDLKKFVKALKISIVPLSFYITFFIFMSDFDSSLGYNSIFYVIGWIIIYILGTGLTEEIFARGILIDRLKKSFKLDNKKNVYICCILSSIIFGLSHIINYFSVGYIPIGQMLQTIGMGLFLCAIYLRSKSIFGVALVHGLWDIFASLDKILYVQETVEKSASSIQFQIVGGIITMIPSVIIFLILMRKSILEECYDINK